MKTTTISELAEVNPRLSSAELPSDDASVVFLPMASVSELGEIENVVYRPLKEIRKGFTSFRRGDVVVAKITPCMENGKAAHLGELSTSIGFGSTEFHVLRPKPNVDGRYLFHAIWNERFRFHAQRKMSGAAGHKRVPKRFLESYVLPHRTPSEQKRIAAILDKADEIRKKRKEAIRLTEELLNSVFLDMFGDPVTNPKGWPVKSLGDVCVRVTDGTHQSPTWAASGVPFLFIRNLLQDGEISFSTQKFISEDTWRELTRRCPIEVGDILYSTVGSYGNAALVTAERKFAFQRHIAHIKPDRNVFRPAFLALMLSSPGVRRQADRLARGVAQKTVNLKELKSFQVLVPEMKKQDEFIRRASAIKDVVLTIKTATKLVDEGFNALSQKFFSAEVS